MLEAVHIIQQAYYNFVLRRRVASLAPYTLPDKGHLFKKTCACSRSGPP